VQHKNWELTSHAQSVDQMPMTVTVNDAAKRLTKHPIL